MRKITSYRVSQFCILVLIILMITGAFACTNNEYTPLKLKDPTKKPQASIPKDKMLTADDILGEDIPMGPYMSPDATRVMWITMRYTPEENLPVWDMYVTDLSTLQNVKVLAGSGLIAGVPKWSPNGQSFAYINTSLDGTNQLFTLPASGGEPSQITSVPEGVIAHAWRNASTLVFTAPVDAGAEGSDDTIQVSLESNDKIRLWQVDALGGQVVPVTKNDDQITKFWISPDGNKALTIQTRASGGGDAYYQKIKDKKYLVNLADGTAKEVLKDVRVVNGATWSGDSKTVWIEDAYTPDKLVVATATLLRTLDVQRGQDSRVELDWSRGLHSQTGATPPMLPTADGFVAMLADGCNPKIASYAVDGKSLKRLILKGQHQGSIFAFDISKNGAKICYLYSTPSKPPQMYTADIVDGAITNPKCFTSLNPGLSGKGFVRHEVISWEGANGEAVEGILYYPNGYKPGKKYPLILMLHGGPFHIDLAEWPSNTYTIYPYQLMAQKGAFVLAPNYHGSSEYGLDFARSIRNGKFYDFPMQDIENAISRLTVLGLIDEERLGTLGWSNGSILSHALIAQDQRFKAASCGAGGNEWTVLWGSGAEGGALLEYYFGASPIEDPGLYKDAAMAPFYQSRDVKTPVVMYQGDADLAVPPGMSWTAYRGLQKYSKAPVELFIFPGEGHGPIMRSHLQRKMTEDSKWFDKYLFKVKPANP